MSYFPCQKCGTMIGVIGSMIFTCECAKTLEPVGEATPPVLGTCDTTIELCIGEHDGKKSHPRWNTCLNWRPVESGGAPPQPTKTADELAKDYGRDMQTTLQKNVSAQKAERETPVTPPATPEMGILHLACGCSIDTARHTGRECSCSTPSATAAEEFHREWRLNPVHANAPMAQDFYKEMEAYADLKTRSLRDWKESAIVQLGKHAKLRQALPQSKYLGWDVIEAAVDCIQEIGSLREQLARHKEVLAVLTESNTRMKAELEQTKSAFARDADGSDSNQKWLGWVEPFGPESEPVYMTAARSTVIAAQKAAAARSNYTYKSDEHALADFMICNWATYVVFPENVKKAKKKEKKWVKRVNPYDLPAVRKGL